MDKVDLMRPEAYGALRPQQVLGIDTHISWVFLLERDVFKVKRPVDLGFLDFRTLAQRKAACEAEVLLNARLAPGVYRGVVPVRAGADGRACIGDQGPIVDWAVHMVRLADERRADNLLSAGKLSPSSIDAIATRIAQFHASARCDRETTLFGAPDAVLRNLEENFAQTHGVIERCLRPDEAKELVLWQRAFVRDHTELFERRMATARVRDGHGDLRLEHVYLGDEVTIIDCIEFNDRFRFADVVADIAFLAMDLADQGRVDLAERLLARYAREANDFDLYPLIDFYESYRAYVRAKVCAMLAGDESVDEATRARAEAEARRHFLLALSGDRRSLLSPSVVAVGGIIASGKSTVAERIGDEMGAPVVDADRTRKAMVGVEPTAPLHDPAWHGSYDPAFTESVYDEMLRRAAAVLETGRPVVLDASFRSAAMRRAARELAVGHSVPFRFVECRADMEVCRARLVQRAQERGVSDGRLEIFDSFRSRVEPVTELSPQEHIVLDTTRPLDDSVATLRARLDTWPAGFVG